MLKGLTVLANREPGRRSMTMICQAHLNENGTISRIVRKGSRP
jgi:hypothetical protein